MRKIVLSIDFNPRFIIKILSLIISLTVLLSAISVFFRYSTFQSDLFGLVPKFDMDEENTVPTFISSLNLLIAAATLGIIAYIVKKRNGAFWMQWALMGAIFFGLSVDESASLHEGLSSRFNVMAGGFEGTTHYAWAILGSGLMILFLVYFSRFILHLPAAIRNRFIIAGAIFLAGAIGVEALGGLIYSEVGKDTLVYQVSVVLEETLEMLGILFFVSSLFRYIASYLAEKQAVPGAAVLKLQPEIEEYDGLAQERA